MKELQEMIRYLKNWQNHLFVLIFTGFFSLVFLNFCIDINSFRVKLAHDIAEKLWEGINQNEDLMRYTGKTIINFGEGNLKKIEKIIKPTSDLSHKSLATSYLSWADQEGYVVISGKAGVVKKGEKTIQQRSYFTSAKEDPWFMKISEPERSVFSSKYVLPTALGISDIDGKFLGYLILGLKLDELYDYILPKNMGLGYDVYIFDAKSKKYIPKFNSDDTTYFKLPERNVYQYKVRGTDLEIHIYRHVTLIFWDWANDHKILLLAVLGALTILCFLMCHINSIKKRLGRFLNLSSAYSFEQIIEGIQEKITDLDNRNTYLEELLVRKDKSREIIGHTLIERTAHQKEVFNRLRNNLNDLGVIIKTIKEVSNSEKLTWLVTKCQMFIDDFEHIGILETVKQSFSLNSVVSESLMYYGRDFDEGKIKVYKNLSNKIPICTGDPLILKQILVSILGKILEESYGLGKIEIKTRYGINDQKCFQIEILEKAAKDKLLYPFMTESISEFVMKLGYEIYIEVDNKMRHWVLLFNEAPPSKNGQNSKLASVHSLKPLNKKR